MSTIIGGQCWGVNSPFRCLTPNGSLVGGLGRVLPVWTWATGRRFSASVIPSPVRCSQGAIPSVVQRTFSLRVESGKPIIEKVEFVGLSGSRDFARIALA